MDPAKKRPADTPYASPCEHAWFDVAAIAVVGGCKLHGFEFWHSSMQSGHEGDPIEYCERCQGETIDGKMETIGDYFEEIRH